MQLYFIKNTIINKWRSTIAGCMAVMLFTGCEKLIAPPEPYYSVTTENVFNSESKANAALAGVYSEMINGLSNSYTAVVATDGFALGASTVAASMSADELVPAIAGSVDFFSQNRLTQLNGYNYFSALWRTAYQAIYGCNAILEGVAASTSPKLRDSARKQLEGEAKFLRAFSYFYLTNFFGDVPLVLTIDLSKTMRMARTAHDLVYKQVIQDLKDAVTLLQEEYNVTANERVRPNKSAAAALLARAYLYLRDYENAFIQANNVIGKTQFYSMPAQLNDVFAYNSPEAIWQLKQTNTSMMPGNATAEGMYFLPVPLESGVLRNMLSENLLNAFEPGDQRKNDWVGITDQVNTEGYHLGIAYYPYKYKTGGHNYSSGGPYTEYYMVLRLAEQYLIRAEAQANGAGAGLTGAIDDLNVVRNRADLDDLPGNLSQTDVTTALEKEWRVEFFCEWGHRWFNLKRTGRASQVLSAINYKQPWTGDFQLLYPIPYQEIINNNNLTQNKGY